MQVTRAETFAKGPNQENEDAVFLGDGLVAVIDGSTSKGSAPGKTGGRLAVEVILATLARARPQKSARELTDELSVALRESGLAGKEPPSAGALIFSDPRREVWAIGDGWIVIGKQRFHRSHAIERAAAKARAALLATLLESGGTVEELMADDMGRKMIQPLLASEWRMRNVDKPGSWYWGGLDGRTVPDRHLFVSRIPSGVRRIVLASDGYPELADNFEASEEGLRTRIERDPLLISDPPQTKGVLPGNDTFDDRTWVEVAL